MTMPDDAGILETVMVGWHTAANATAPEGFDL
jgi:hypothetical protein